MSPPHDVPIDRATLGPGVTALNGVAVVVLFNFLPEHRPWAWINLMQGPGGYLRTIPGLQFAKIMGSGQGGGFGLKPSSTHQGFIFFFDGPQSASQYLMSDALERIRSKAQEWWQGILGVNSCRGSWSEQSWKTEGVMTEGMAERQPPQTTQTPGTPQIPKTPQLAPEMGYMASLTRGSVRARKAWSFWRFAPQAQADLQKAQGLELSIGLGEAPILRQCTFSVWNSPQSMLNYAHQGAHLRAIAAAQQHGFFTESMFVRMKVLHMKGIWGGRVFDCTTPEMHSLGLAN
jgi:hypothetical protein